MDFLNSEGRRILDLRVPAAADSMDTVHAALAGCWSKLAPCTQLERRWQDEFALAVAEVAANIIQFAYVGDSPVCEFALTLTRYPNRLTARFVDHGAAAGLDAPVMPNINVPVAELGERGRGLALVRVTTDRFEYQRTAAGENVWIIEKVFAA